MKQWRKSALAACCAAIAFSLAAGCARGGESGGGATAPAADSGGGDAPYAISVMAKSYTNDNATPESRIWQTMEEVTNTKLDITFTPDANYNDKLNITMASGSIPSVIFAPNIKLPTVANAIKGGVFWEVGPYLQDYPNLKQYNPTTLNNTSFNGKIYGLPTVRPLGRNGISYRSDWLDKLGLDVPETIDDFYNMLKAFASDDPDGNGQDDTYGMVVTKYPGPWDIMQTWFGVPNKWGAADDGTLVPAHLTPEYMDALRFFKRLYDEKLINQDFAVYDSAKWNDPIIASKAGVAIDVVDRSYQIEESLKPVNPDGSIGVIGSVSGPQGLRLPATTGYAGVFLISKSAVKTEEELKKVLNFFDKIGDRDMQILLNHGIEGVHYRVEGDGRLVTLLDAEDPQAPDINNKNLVQLNLGVPNVLDTAFEPGTPLRELANKVKAANEEIIIANPAEPFVSETYTTKGAQLDQQIEDARTKFIVGQLDEAGLQAEIELWRQNGGDDYIREINEAYEAASANAS